MGDTLTIIMKLKIGILTILLWSFMHCSTSQSVTGSNCRTPTNDKGTCINIYSCQPMIAALNDETVSEDFKFSLKRYLCGFDKLGQPKVCCPNKPIVDVQKDTEHTNMVLLPTDCGVASFAQRITNGDKADLYEFPWQVALKYESSKPIPYHCGGSLINNRYVLTAAHCVTTRLKLIGVRLGEYDFQTEKDCIKLPNTMDCAPPVQDFDITERDAVVHSEYKKNFLYDIALIRLPRNAEYNAAVSPVCLPINENLTPKVIRNLTVVGWGNTEKGRVSSVLLKVTVPYQENSICNEVFKKVTQIQDSQLCAGGRDGKDSCNGDSGGPIMMSLNDEGEVRAVQVGLVSFGHNECGKEKFPGVYTRLTSYIDWILDNIKP